MRSFLTYSNVFLAQKQIDTQHDILALNINQTVFASFFIVIDIRLTLLLFSSYVPRK
ncbi:hypothetical protein GYMLUDRAFT_400203 [Collybiopsis luxurians FD-317 M1]|nr:hypothetical protein GYMLUDRAFT_400203 [Collybiopsis luxurians FD-317 M1]